VAKLPSRPKFAKRPELESKSRQKAVHTAPQTGYLSGRRNSQPIAKMGLSAPSSKSSFANTSGRQCRSSQENSKSRSKHSKCHNVNEPAIASEIDRCRALCPYWKMPAHLFDAVRCCTQSPVIGHRCQRKKPAIDGPACHDRSHRASRSAGAPAGLVVETIGSLSTLYGHRC
jgi:hypothetical protein